MFGGGLSRSLEDRHDGESLMMRHGQVALASESPRKPRVELGLLAANGVNRTRIGCRCHPISQFFDSSHRVLRCSGRSKDLRSITSRLTGCRYPGATRPSTE